MVVSGVGYGGEPNVILGGGRAWVCPAIQKVQRIPLQVMTIKVVTERVYTIQGVPLSVNGTAQVKINSENDLMLKTAAEQFADKTVDEISSGE